MTAAPALWPTFEASYSKLVQVIGTRDFLPLLATLAESLIGYNSTVIIAYPKNQLPSIIYNDTDYFEKEEINKEFINVSHVLDPFYQMIKRGAPEGIYMLSDVAPDEFYESEFYQQVYAQTGLQKEVGLLLDIPDKFSLEISVGLRGDRTDESDEVAILQPYFNLVRSAIESHFTVQALEPQEFGLQLNDYLANFGKDYLSHRECEVLQLVLQGYSTKAMAPLLEVSTETIKVYRKRIHTKLNISSQSELFSLFLEAASTMPANSTVDPLTLYFAGGETH